MRVHFCVNLHIYTLTEKLWGGCVKKYKMAILNFGYVGAGRGVKRGPGVLQSDHPTYPTPHHRSQGFLKQMYTQWSVTRGLSLEMAYSYGVPQRNHMAREISILATLVTVVVAFGGALTWAQMGAHKSCADKGPQKCSVAAIRAW